MNLNNFFYRTTLFLVFINIFRTLSGLISQIVIAASFGASAPLDAYLVTFSLPQIFGDFLLGGVMFFVLIPMFMEYKSKQDEESAWELILNITNIFNLILFIVMLGYVFLAPFWIRLLAPGFSLETSATAIIITRIIFPLFILMSMVWITSALLNSYNNFLIPALSAVVPPLTIVFFVLIFRRQWGIYSLAGGILIGSLIQLLMQWFALPVKRYRFSISITEGVKKSLYLAVPIFATVIVYNLVAVYQRFLASKLAVGNISALNFANYVINAFLSILCIPLVTVIFPFLSSQALEGNNLNFKNTCAKGIKLINFISLPLTMYLVIFYYPLTKIIFNRGNFGTQDVHLTSSALLFLSIGFFAFSGITLLSRVFYSLKDMTTPLYLSSIVLISSLPLNYFLCKLFGIKGLALATSIATTIIYIAFLYALNRKIGVLKNRGMIISFIKTLVVAILAVLSAAALFNYFLKCGIFNLTANFFIATIFSVILFILLAFIAGISEIGDFLPLFLKRRSDLS
ncbi:MAG: murein biosynthesis integral membrane protein MurJ [Candidatus Omnitrophota bacterium]|nr:murein biosynthesis integral membrane protein MurJ [Candidatus Omnitrophota bacterium]